MMSFFLSIAILSLSLYLTSLVVPGLRLKSTGETVAAGVLLWLLRVTVGKVLTLLSLPLIVLTFGLFAVLNQALMLHLLARWSKALEFRGPGATVLAAGCLMFIEWVLHLLL